MSSLSTASAQRGECGESEAPSFIAIFRAHGPYVWRLLRRLGVSPSDADDLCQEVFVIVHRRWSELDKDRPLRPWIYGVAFRVASDHRRHRRPRLAPLESQYVVAPPVQHEMMEQRQARDRLEEAIGRLDESKRAIFVLHELEELSMTEIADAVSCPLQTAYSRLHAARKEVKAFFIRLEAKKEAFR